MLTNNWSQRDANALTRKAGRNSADRELALRVYTSRLIGNEPDLVMHGGGNTSFKAKRKDIYGKQTDVLHIKGSGWNLDSIEAPGLPAVRLEPLHKLRALRALGDQDMVNALRCNLLDASAPTPSVETLLHAYLPHKYVDHTHAGAFMVLANLPDVRKAIQDIFGSKMALVPYIAPGFELAKAAADIYDDDPSVEGMVLANHGHFTFGDSARESYTKVIEQTNKVLRWLAKRSNIKPSFKATRPTRSVAAATRVLPLLRGALGDALAQHSQNPDAAMPIFDLRCGPGVKRFLARKDLREMARRGVPTPDHVIRTKGSPLLLSEAELDKGRPAIDKAVAAYVAKYQDYFARNAKHSKEAKTMLAPTPSVAWISNVGVVGIGQDAAKAKIAADLAEQRLAVAACAEDSGGFRPISQADQFEMEYWSLEQAKLGKAKPARLAGKVALLTGAAGAIGAATAQAFARQGCELVLIDQNRAALANLNDMLGGNHLTVVSDITKAGSAQQAVAAGVARYGGLDILISNAGAAWTDPIIEINDAKLRRSYELNFFAHHRFAQTVAKLLIDQGRGGQILINVSKQAVNPGKNFGAYGLPKSSAMFLVKQLALELGGHGIRVNGLNPDRIRSGILTGSFIQERAQARGVTPAQYMGSNLLGKEVEARHVADAFLALACSERTTAHVMTVDGGNIEASLR